MNQRSVASQVESLQRQFAQAPGLPFADLLPAELITRLLQEQDKKFCDRLYAPLATLIESWAYKISVVIQREKNSKDCIECRKEKVEGTMYQGC